MAALRKPRKRDAEIAFDAISIEGGLLVPEWLSRIAQLRAGQQSEGDYRIDEGLTLRDEISRYWRMAQFAWTKFSAGKAAGADPQLVTEQFITTLLRKSFAFGTLSTCAPVEVQGRMYPIGFSAVGGRVPVVLAPAGGGVDTLAPAFGDANRRRSAFGLAQECLNADDRCLWGLVTDGMTLRLLRDNASLTRPAWIEVDLARIFSEERYAEFTALWLLVHESRFGRADLLPSECALEAWRNAGREEGTRMRDQLRDGVEAALLSFGNGFLNHPDNGSLRDSLRHGSLTAKTYHQQLLRLVYRLLFLLTVEERGVLHPQNASEAGKSLYERAYGLQRLRARSVKRNAHDRHADLWESVKVVFRALSQGESRLGLPALAGIFASEQCAALDTAKVENHALLGAMFRLSWLRGNAGLERVNWRDMGPEELGSVYESLLELVPVITNDCRTFDFAKGEESKGHTRRLTGSYYTPDRLVQVLLDSALEPVIQSTIAAHSQHPANALLQLAIVDPACGSGHFLLAATRRLASHVARLQANGTPSAADYQHAVRQVVGRCLYGVDLNPMAVELCKVGLWMEAVDPGRPLSFLDSHIRHGNALLGTTKALMDKGIPDEAWETIDGDDKKVAAALKRKNRLAAGGQRGLLFAQPTENASVLVAKAVAELEAAPDGDLSMLAQKRASWERLLASAAYREEKVVADAWCAAFVWPKVPGPLQEAAPTNEVWRQVKDKQRTSLLTQQKADELAEQYRFFHWELEFPQIFSEAKGGFDVVIGNPPWIAHAGRAAQPLPAGAKAFYLCNFDAFADYPTTHGMFVSLAARVLRTSGYMGLVIPSSLSELGGYKPTRLAHDKLCSFPGELIDFGEGQFPGVTQPCMALVSKRTAGGRTDAEHGEPWPMRRPDLDPVARRILGKVAKLPYLPGELFGERGVQSDKALAEHFLETAQPADRFTTPIREGADVREFQLLPPGKHVDREALGSRMRGVEEYEAVRIVVRQTARFPIAAISDGCAFRNSLLAVFENEEWPALALVALLNSSLVRWLHYMRFRDARQPVMPQLKIGHLRAIPIPEKASAESKEQLAQIGQMLSERNDGMQWQERTQIDDIVFDMYGLDREERQSVCNWHATITRSGAPEPSDNASDQSTEVQRQKGRPKAKKRSS